MVEKREKAVSSILVVPPWPIPQFMVRWFYTLLPKRLLWFISRSDRIADIQVGDDVINEQELDAYRTWARKARLLICRDENGVRDALSTLKKKTTDTFFRSFGYDYISATVSMEA